MNPNVIGRLPQAIQNEIYEFARGDKKHFKLTLTNSILVIKLAGSFIERFPRLFEIYSSPAQGLVNMTKMYTDELKRIQSVKPESN